MILVISHEGSSTAPAIFFIISMMLGNYMLLNLFLAILLKFITDPENKEEDGAGDAGDENEPFEQGAINDDPNKEIGDNEDPLEN